MRWTKVGVLALSGSLGWGAGGAAAQDAQGAHDAASAVVGEDVVVLTSGARYRGVVAEYEPGVRVVMRLLDGSVRTFSGVEVASVSFGGAAAESPSAATTSVGTAPVAPALPVAPAAPERIVWSEPRDYALSEQRPWSSPFAPVPPPAREPAGDLHFGLQLAGAVDLVLAVPGEDAFVRPAGSVFGFADLRLGHTGTLRFGVTAQFASEERRWKETTFGPDGWYSTHPPLWGVGLRVLVGHDLSSDVTLRFGVEGGNHELADTGEIAARAEISARLLERRTLEVGGALVGGATWVGEDVRTVDDTGREEVRDGSGIHVAGLVRAEVYAAWVFE